MRLRLQDSEIAYDFKHVDSARPAVLFLHGALGVRGQFKPLQQRFGDHSCLTVDFPSHGESRAAAGEMNSERLARDMLALLAALELGKTDIIGHSMGGYVGLVMAHLAPERINTVTTFGTKFYWDDATLDKTASELDSVSLRARSARYYDALVASHTGGGAEQALAFTQSLIADFRRWRLDERMVAQAGVPVLATPGDRDDMVPAAEIMRLFCALDPSLSAAAVVPGAPHPLQKLPVECFEHIVRQFWSLQRAR